MFANIQKRLNSMALPKRRDLLLPLQLVHRMLQELFDGPRQGFAALGLQIVHEDVVPTHFRLPPIALGTLFGPPTTAVLHQKDVGAGRRVPRASRLAAVPGEGKPGGTAQGVQLQHQAPGLRRVRRLPEELLQDVLFITFQARKPMRIRI